MNGGRNLAVLSRLFKGHNERRTIWRCQPLSPSPSRISRILGISTTGLTGNLSSKTILNPLYIYIYKPFFIHLKSRKYILDIASSLEPLTTKTVTLGSFLSTFTIGWGPCAKYMGSRFNTSSFCLQFLALPIKKCVMRHAQK